MFDNRADTSLHTKELHYLTQIKSLCLDRALAIVIEPHSSLLKLN